MHTHFWHVLLCTSLMSTLLGCPDEPVEDAMSMDMMDRTDMSTVLVDMSTVLVDMSSAPDASGTPDLALDEDMGEEVDLADSPRDDMGAPGVDLFLCDDSLELEHGTLCVIRPSKTDAAILDVAPDAVMPIREGFGFHVVGLPNNLNEMRGIWVHFGGAYGQPYFPGNKSYGSSVWTDELMEQGFLVIQVAYSNNKSVNGDFCGRQNQGHDIDDCAGLVRREILEGVDYTSLLDVNVANGYFNRINTLLDYLRAQDVQLPAQIAQAAPLDWSTVHVSGHSQGAGHAYFIAKTIGVKSACFLGGPYDSVDSVDPGVIPIADWYTVPGTQTPVEDMGAFVVVGDDSYRAFTGAYELIGLVKGESWFDDAGTYDNPHGASLAEPSLKAKRAQACFDAAAGL